MDIAYKGGNSLVISTKKTTLAFDPKVSLLGLKDPALSGAVELLTEPRYLVDGARLVIDSPGEFEVGEFSIRGVAARRSLNGDGAENGPQGLDATVYRVETEEFRIGVIGNIAPKLSDEQLESIGVLDILVIPVGGSGFTLDPHDAAAIVRQIDPRVVIPVHYEDTGLAYEVPQLPLDSFTRELNVPVETPDKFKPKNTAALPETLTVVALMRG